MISHNGFRAPLVGLLLVLLCATGGPCLGQAQSGPTDPAQDSVKLSFVFLGCNRIQHKDWKKSKADNPSSANLPQFHQTLQDIAHLDPVPPYLFFMGDLVVNLEDDDGKALKKQLDAWTPLFKASPLAAKTTLVPLPGNHEMLKKVADDKDQEDQIEVPNAATNARWLKWLRDSGFDTFAKAANGPTNAPPNLDELTDDQSEMTYSFNLGDVHFVVINTDTLNTNIDQDTNAPHIGWVPYHWLEHDVRTAQANAKVSAIFLIGHKPILDHPQAEEKAILNTNKHPLGDQLQALFQANDKVRAYLCAHEHLWDCSRLKKAPKVWQVIAGNAGSKLNGKWNPPGGTFFGFSQINVYASGKVGLVSYSRPTPEPPQKYFEGAPVPPARPQPEVILYPLGTSGIGPIHNSRERRS
ncbi:MAG: metallophosphoesterase [Isosphaerales bacterium]